MYQRKSDLEPVILTSEGRFLGPDLVELTERQIVEVCDVCEELGTDDDPLGHFRHPLIFGTYVICHGQCGEDADLDLA